MAPYLIASKKKWKIVSNCVAFSKYLNFISGSQELRDIASRRPAVVKALTIMVKVSAKIKVSIVKLCNM